MSNNPIPKLLTWEQAKSKRREWGQEGFRVVFTNGCFDILHSGHVELLEKAGESGDRLLVAINSDDSVKRIKGDDRPIRSEEERAEIIGGLKCVDGVVIFQQDDPLEIIKLIEPDILVKGGDWSPENIIGADVVQARKGEVVVVPLKPSRSTTAILGEIKKSGI